jgi:hypothetical protein
VALVEANSEPIGGDSIALPRKSRYEHLDSRYFNTKSNRRTLGNKTSAHNLVQQVWCGTEETLFATDPTCYKFGIPEGQFGRMCQDVPGRTIDTMHCLPYGLNSDWCMVGASTPVVLRMNHEETASVPRHSKFDVYFVADYDGESVYPGQRIHGVVDGWNAARIQKTLALYFPMFQIFQTAQECLYKCVGHNLPASIAPNGNGQFLARFVYPNHGREI